MKKITLDGIEYNLVPVDTTQAEEIQSAKTPAKHPNGSLVERVPNSEEYWYIDDWGIVSPDTESGVIVDEWRHQTRNYFLTEADAQSWRDKLIRAYKLRDKIEEINREHGWVVDWKNEEQKYLVIWCRGKISNSCIAYQTSGYYMSRQAKDYMMSDAVSDEDFQNFIFVMRER